ncbi:MAG TPA: hypothetical protein VL332_07200 [Candidatus Saccharimonadaceae bacterium]|jgi:photosystem II stability/assembly factor-like uncharacterized protein|nr:hypothetical protein [Candidatus Saccharimonadaceae bacterium]
MASCSLSPAARVVTGLALGVVLSIAGVADGRAAVAREPAAGGALDSKLLKELSWRSVGPANMGGRIAAIASSAEKPTTIYLGFGTGGVFKTTNHGTTWNAVWERQPVASIGAIALQPKNPNVVWVGTGEANSRNSSSWGNGVYRSDDGGDTWTHLGLTATASIARIVVSPKDSNTVFVAALGRLWGENPERGVFRTTDGGKTWAHVLKVDARTGAVDLAMDPSDPNTLYAALYARRRTAWSYTSGGTTGGIFRTRDGGRTWTKLTNGLPATTGRIGLDVFLKNPKVVYAVVESDDGGHLAEFEDKSRTGGVFRTEDGGDHWARLSPYTPRSFYFSQIRVQPDDESRIYLLGTDLWISDDGGRTFRAGGAKNLHPDCHAMWVDAGHPEHVMMGTDGGLFVSWDRAATWDFINNLATGEFYNLALDNRDPYRIYGGLQDNQSWGGPSRTWFEPEPFIGDQEHNGILNDDWMCLGGGDGFHVAVDPVNPDLVYYESQQGYLNRVDLKSHRERNLRPSNKEGEERFRFNWNTPFLISPHDPSVLWLGGNHVFRLLDRGDRWEMASPDLSTQDPKKLDTGGSGAETHCTIVSLTESAKQAGQVWAGTDDGKLWVTVDGGRNWSDLTANLRGAPAGLYVSRIEASHHDARTAYVALDGHRSDLFAPYLFVTHDLGRSWTSIASDLPKDQPVMVVREDLENPRLLFAGTEFGLYMSQDAGGHWLRLDQGLPTVAVDDIQIHPRERDLVAATHGRSVYVLDDITPFERWGTTTTTDSITFFAPRGATAYYIHGIGGAWGQRVFTAKNPVFGAYFNYWCGKDLADGVTISVADSAGHKLRKLMGPGTKGLHRVAWDLVAGDPKERIDRPEWNDQPLFVKAGTYKVTLTAGKTEVSRNLEVRVPEGVAEPGN